MGMMATILLFIGTFFVRPTVYAADASGLVTIINEWAHGGTGILEAAVNAADDSEVIVTGDVTGATAVSLALNIDPDVVVNWQANLNGTATVALSGDGEFLMTDGNIDYLGTSNFAIASTGNNAITVNDGEITGGIMAYGANNIVTVNGGTVTGATTAKTNNYAISASGTNGKVIVSGGTVTTTGGWHVIYMEPANTGLNVVVSGTGKVIQAGSSEAVSTFGSVEVKDDAEVSSISSYAINVKGTTGTVTISGGKVTAASANAVVYVENTANTGLNVVVSGSGEVIHTGVGNGISTYGSVEVKDDAVITASNIALRIRSGTATISGGTVTSTASDGAGISAEETDSKVIVTGGKVTATNSRAIYAGGSNSKVIVTGGEVITGNSFAGISLANVNAVAFISGGTVSSVVTYSANTVVFISGGTVSLVETSYGANSIEIRKSGSEVSFIAGTSNNLTASPEGASAVWAVEGGKSGVHYVRNSNEGFLETPGITVVEILLYTVTFDYNDGGTTAALEVDVEDGNKVTEPANPTRDEYTFDGWFAAGASNAFNFDTPITNNITLVAHWTKVPVTGNGEIFAPDFKIFPNPFTDILRIEGAEGSTLQVINGNGVIEHIQKIENDNETLRLQHLQQGVYFFRIVKDQKMFTLKVVKL